MTNLAKPILLDLYRRMLLIRRFEEKIVAVYPAQDMKTPVHLYIGEEAIAAGVCAHLAEYDYVFTTHRSHGHCLAKGVDPAVLYAEFYGRVTGCCQGKGGSMHPASPEHGILGTSAIVAGGIPLAVGAALASQMRRDGKISVAFFGDGAADEGTFHESLNFAALRQLPVIFVCENNFYATSSPQRARQSSDNIDQKAAAYNMPGVQIDGNNVLDVYAAAQKAVQRARAGEGPALLECRTYRWKGHVGPQADYEQGIRPQEELEHWMQRCPVTAYEHVLVSQGVCSEAECQSINRAILDQLETAWKLAKSSPFPEPDDLFTNLFKVTDKA